MKSRLRELTTRSNGWGNEYRIMKLTQFISGWVNYFALADLNSRYGRMAAAVMLNSVLTKKEIASLGLPL